MIDRVNGCKKVLGGIPDIKVLSSDQDGKGSRDGGLNVMQGYLTRFPDIKGVFTINDPQAIGSDLAANSSTAAASSSPPWTALRTSSPL